MRKLQVPLGRLLAPWRAESAHGRPTMTAVGRAFLEAEPESGITIGVIPSIDEDHPGIALGTRIRTFSCRS
ncbi:MAG: hypothetical protein R3E97_11465 [Candidatus Eisenbacteria bacterium]